MLGNENLLGKGSDCFFVSIHLIPAAFGYTCIWMFRFKGEKDDILVSHCLFLAGYYIYCFKFEGARSRNFRQFQHWSNVYRILKNNTITAQNYRRTQTKYRKAKEGHGWTKVERIQMDSIWVNWKNTGPPFFKFKSVYIKMSFTQLENHSQLLCGRDFAKERLCQIRAPALCAIFRVSAGTLLACFILLIMSSKAQFTRTKFCTDKRAPHPNYEAIVLLWTKK